jgi:hypothetical protein
MAPRDLPIACSLDAAALQAREAELARLGGSLISVTSGEGPPAVLRFKPDRRTRAQLDRIVAAESECCPFLQMTVREGEALELTIDGPDDAAPVIAELAGTISGSAPGSR